jgi:hypothetical protein
MFKAAPERGRLFCYGALRGSMSQQAEVNGQMQDMCESCGAVVGHGCPDSEPCNCGEEEPEYKGMNGVCCK